LSALDLVFPLVPRQRLLGLPFGPMHSARRGLGSDVAGSRPYRPGDDVDAIDWYASARLSAAHAADEFVVRERFAEEGPRIVSIVDRRPSMALYPADLPWLSKPETIDVALAAIAASGFAARGFAGYLDVAEAAHPNPRERSPEPFYRSPQSQAAYRRFELEALADRPFHAAEDTLEEAFAFLREAAAALPRGTFLFVLSDFLEAPEEDVWAAALERGWDPIPVVVQEPVWERSFPDVGGVAVPVFDPATGRREVLRMTSGEARRRRARNEARFQSLLDGFADLGVEPVVISSSQAADVLEAFLEWAGDREVHATELRRGAVV
jgi:uncharacterized protein (DUF58 family)